MGHGGTLVPVVKCSIEWEAMVKVQADSVDSDSLGVGVRLTMVGSLGICLGWILGLKIWVRRPVQAAIVI